MMPKSPFRATGFLRESRLRPHVDVTSKGPPKRDEGIMPSTMKQCQSFEEAVADDAGNSPAKRMLSLEEPSELKQELGHYP